MRLSYASKGFSVVGPIPGDLAHKDVRADDGDGRARSADGRGTVCRIADDAHAALGPAVEFDLGVRLHVKIIRFTHAGENA